MKYAWTIIIGLVTKRFKKLPPNISLDYFCQGLRNTHKSNKQKLQPQIGFVM